MMNLSATTVCDVSLYSSSREQYSQVLYIMQIQALILFYNYFTVSDLSKNGPIVIKFIWLVGSVEVFFAF